MKIYQELAFQLNRYKFNQIAKRELDKFCDKYLPHGSGFDSGIKVNVEKSRADKIVLDVPYRPMDENGFYKAWVQYTCIVTPTFEGIDLVTKGRDNNGLREYVDETMYHALVGETQP